jgi:hypothetical protein
MVMNEMLKYTVNHMTPKIAEEALNWLAAIKESAVAPEPERDQSYCRFYCKYFDESGKVGCTGIKKELIKEVKYL